MNLVQINERLKEMPLQAVQQYANGMNPEIPPYLALGELQRRETAHKKAALAQGAASGPQPSVKEQIEQKAGLMALQMQQKQAQMQAPPPQSGPIPENIPQPVPQPQAAMACGGIARLPVRPGMYDFAEGGIIAFSGEDRSDVPDEEELKKSVAEAIRKRMKQRTDMKPENMSVSDLDFLNIPGLEKSDLYKKAMQSAQTESKEETPAPAPSPVSERKPYTGPQQYTLQQQGADWVKRKLAAQEDEKKKPSEPSEYMRQMGEVGGFLGNAGLNAIKHILNYPGTGLSSWKDKEKATQASATSGLGGLREPEYANVGANVAPPRPSPAGNARANRPAVPPSAAPATAAPAQAAPAQAADSGIPGLNDPAFLAAAKRAMEEPNQEQAIKDYKARMAAMGLEGLYGTDQERRIRDLDAQYKKGLENRGLERLMRVLQARNMGEYGSRYLGSVEQERAADLAQAARMNELLAGVEGKRREEGMTGVKTVGEELEKRRGTAAQAATSLSGSQMQAGVSRANQLSQNQTQLQIAELDRKLRERLHNTPAAQKPSVEEQAIKDYVDAGMTRIQAFEKVKTIGAGMKGEMTIDQARDNVRKDLENPLVSGQMQKDAAAALKQRGIANPTSIQIMDYLVEQQMKGSKRATGATGSATLPAGFQLDK